MFDAVSLALLADLKNREASSWRPVARTSSIDDEPAEPGEPGAGLYAIPRLLAGAVALLLAVRIQIVIAR